MDEEFKKIIIRDHDQTRPENRQAFLKMLKLHPEQVLQIVSEHLPCWVLNASQELGRTVSFNINSDPAEVIQAFKEHFATELAAIQE